MNDIEITMTAAFLQPARDVQRGYDVADPIGARGVAMDVPGTPQFARAVDRLRQEVETPDVPVNNAGMSDTQRPRRCRPT